MLVSFYETWGKLLQKRLLPIYTFDGMGSIVLIKTFERLEGYIRYRRNNKEENKGENEEKDASSYAYYFEYRYVRVKNRRNRIKKLCKLPLLGKAFKKHYYGISKSKFDKDEQNGLSNTENENQRRNIYKETADERHYDY